MMTPGQQPPTTPYGSVPSVDAVVARRANIERRIAAVTDRSVRIVGVTKGFGPEIVEVAVAAGITEIGENYAQELQSKHEAIRRVGSSGQGAVRVHFIGQLQSNKVRSLVGRVDRFDSVDRESLVLEIARRAPGAHILIQVNATGEPHKGGCAPSDLAPLVSRARTEGLIVEGLMAVGPTHGGPDAAGPVFARVRALADDLGLEECSMGMSEDLEVAVAHGATEVRIGTALWGARPIRPG